MNATRGNVDHNTSPVLDSNTAWGVDMADFVGNEGLIAHTIRAGRTRASARGAGRNLAEINKKRCLSVIKALPVDPELFELGDKVLEARP